MSFPPKYRRKEREKKGRDTDTSRRFTKRADRAESIERGRRREADAAPSEERDQYSAQASHWTVPMGDIYIS